MRIAVWHDLPSGGGRRALAGQLKGLLALGHEIAVWGTPQEAGPLSVPARVQQMVLALPEAGARRRSPAARLTATPAVFERFDEHCRAAAAAIKRWAPDVVLGSSSLQLGTAPLARHLPDQATVLYLQEPFRPTYEEWEGRALWRAPDVSGQPLHRALLTTFFDVRETTRSRILAREERDSAAAYDRILVNSYFSREALVRAYGLGSRTCYLGVEDEPFVPRATAAPRGQHVVSVGQFSRHKDPELIVTALGMLPSPPPLVWIANTVDEALLQRVQQQADAVGVRLVLRSAVSDEELVATYQDAVALVYAPRLEPFGYAPLEAAACGTPTVAVAEGGVRETVLDGETGLLTDGTPEALGAAVGRVLDDPRLVEALGAAAQRRVRAEFGQGAAVARLERHLREVAAERGGA